MAVYNTDNQAKQVSFIVKVQLNLVMTQDKIKRACIFDNHMQVRAELVWADKKNTSLFLSLLCHQIFCLNF